MAPEQAHGARRRAPQRPLRARRDAVRARLRPAALHGRHGHGGRAAPARGARAALAPRGRRAAALDALLLALLAKDERSARPRRPRCATGWAAPGRPRSRLAPRRAAGRPRGGARPPRGRSSPPPRPARRASRRSPGRPGSARRASPRRWPRTPARRGAGVLWGRAAEEATPFAPWRPILHALRDAEQLDADPRARDAADLARLAGEGGAARRSRRRTGRGSSTRSRARSRARPPTRPHVVVLEDLHWADASSLALLRHVSGALEAARVLARAHPPRRRRRAQPSRAPETDRPARARAGGRAPAAAARRRRAGDRRGRAPPHGRQPVLRARARPAAGGGGGRPRAARRRARAPCATWSRGGSTRCPRPPSGGWRPARCSGGPFGIGIVARLVGGSPADAADAVDEALAAELLVEAAEHPGPPRLPPRHRARRGLRPAVPPRAHPDARRRRGRCCGTARAATSRPPTSPTTPCSPPAAAWAPTPRGRTRSPPRARPRPCSPTPRPGRYYEQALEACELGAAPSEPDRAAAIAALAAACLAAGDVEGSRRRHRQAAALARRRGDAAALADAALGFAHLQPYGEVDHDAIALLQEALDALAARRRRHARAAARAARPPDGSRRGPAAARGARAARPWPMATRLGDDRTAITAQVAAGMVEWRPERVAAAARGRRRRPAPRRPARRDDDAVLWARTQRFADALRRGDAPRHRRRARPLRRDRARDAPRATTTGGSSSCARAARSTAGAWPRPTSGSTPRGGGATGTSRTTRRQEATRRSGSCSRRCAGARSDVALAHAARLRRPLPPAAGVGGDGRGRRVGARRRRAPPAAASTRAWAAASRRSAARPTGSSALAILADPVAGVGRPRGRSRSCSRCSSSTPPSTRASTTRGRPGARWRAAPGCWPPRPATPERAAAHFEAGAGARRGLARAGVGAARGRRLAAQRRAGARPRRARRRVLHLARELELPWVAARFADAVLTRRDSSAHAPRRPSAAHMTTP